MDWGEPGFARMGAMGHTQSPKLCVSQPSFFHSFEIWRFRAMHTRMALSHAHLRVFSSQGPEKLMPIGAFKIFHPTPPSTENRQCAVWKPACEKLAQAQQTRTYREWSLKHERACRRLSVMDPTSRKQSLVSCFCIPTTPYACLFWSRESRTLQLITYARPP